MVRVTAVVLAPTLSCTNPRIAAFPLLVGSVTAWPTTASVSAVVTTLMFVAAWTSTPNSAARHNRLASPMIASWARCISLLLLLFRDALLQRGDPHRLHQLLMGNRRHAGALAANAHSPIARVHHKILIALIGTFQLHTVFIRRQWTARVMVDTTIPRSVGINAPAGSAAPDWHQRTRYSSTSYCGAEYWSAACRLVVRVRMRQFCAIRK